MSQPISRVLLVEPEPGARWRSIAAYAEGLRAMLAEAGIAHESVVAPWFNPPSLIRGTRSRWWRQPHLQAARDGAFDLVHIVDHGLAHHSKGLSRHLPVVVTCHDVMPFTVPGYYRSRAEAAVKRAFLRRSLHGLGGAHRVIAVSAYTAGEVGRVAPVEPSRISVVPNVVRDSLVAGALSKSHNGGARILSVGNERGYKNLPALVEALAQPALADATLLRIGAALPNDARGMGERLGVMSRIEELGPLDDASLAEVFAAADVLVQPSLAEGFGVPVIEAMAMGVPVVASDGGALPEVAAGAGIIVPLGPGFAGRLADGIVRAISEREALVQRGQGRASQFRPAAVLPALLAAYEAARARFAAADAGIPERRAFRGRG